MAAGHDEKGGLYWSLVSWGAAILVALVLGWIVAKIFGEAAAGIIFGGVAFVVVAWVLSRYLGPPADDEVAPAHAAHAGHAHSAAHPVAHAPEPVVAPAAVALAELMPKAAAPQPMSEPVSDPGVAISERVRDAARAAGEAARAALGDVAPGGPPVEAMRPAALAASREGGADNLKKIKGVGPKLEDLLHGLGIYHFDQIAAWTPAELAWVDSHLEGFNGRATRDDWIGQSRTLAGGDETEFSQRVDRGEVY